MTITQLEYFLAVVNYGSFSTAAQTCFVTQPSLSVQIQNLEDEMGVILLNRNVKPIVPTEVGQVVLEQAKEAIASFYRTKERINELMGDVSGKVRLGVIPTISPYLMPKFVPEFMKKCPKVKLDVYDMFTYEIIDALNRDIIDAAILSDGEPLRIQSIRIKERSLFDDKLYFYVSPGNELHGRSAISVEELDMTKLLILSDENCPNNEAFKAMCLARQNIKTQYNFVKCSIETLMHMVDTTDAITIIPGMALDHIPESKHSQIIPFKEPNVHRKIMMAVRENFVKTSIVKILKQTAISVSETFAVSNFLRS